MHFCVHFGYFNLVCVTETCCFTLSPYTTILIFCQRHDPPDLLKTIFVLVYKALISIAIIVFIY